MKANTLDMFCDAYLRLHPDLRNIFEEFEMGSGPLGAPEVVTSGNAVDLKEVSD